MAVLTQHIPPATAQKTDSCLFQPPGTLPPVFRVRIGHILGSAAPRGRRPQPPAAQRRKEDMSIPAPRSPGTLFCSPLPPPASLALPPLPALRPRLSAPGSPPLALRPWLSVPGSPSLALRPWFSVPGSPFHAPTHVPKSRSGNFSRTREEAGYQGRAIEIFKTRGEGRGRRPPRTRAAATRPRAPACAAAQAKTALTIRPTFRADPSAARVPSSGRGDACKGSASSMDPRTATSRRGAARCDPPPWHGYGCEGRPRDTPARTRGRTAHAPAAAAGAFASIPAACTRRGSLH